MRISPRRLSPSAIAGSSPRRIMLRTVISSTPRYWATSAILSSGDRVAGSLFGIATVKHTRFPASGCYTRTREDRQDFGAIEENRGHVSETAASDAEHALQLRDPRRHASQDGYSRNQRHGDR